MIPFQFLNVPINEALNLSGSMRCKGCDEDNFTPFKVKTCDDRLCGHCWQKSACNVDEEENKCLACGAETELLCFRDYKQFVGYNVYNGELILAVSSFKDQVSNGTYDLETKAKALKAFEMHEKEVFDCLHEQITKKRHERKAKQAWRKDASNKIKNTKRKCKGKAYEENSLENRILPGNS